MKTANEFYTDCLNAFVKTAQGFGYANSGPRGNDILAKRAEKSVRELLKYRELIRLFGSDPMMYYYYINGLAFAMGVVLAMLQLNAKEKFADRNLIPMIVNDPETSAHDLAYHTMQQFGMPPEIYNQLVQELYMKFTELHEPYWQAKEPRDYTLAAFNASFMTGCSVVICCYEQKRASGAAKPEDRGKDDRAAKAAKAPKTPKATKASKASKAQKSPKASKTPKATKA